VHCRTNHRAAIGVGYGCIFNPYLFHDPLSATEALRSTNSAFSTQESLRKKLTSTERKYHVRL
jgi:hypothetical protein